MRERREELVPVMNFLLKNIKQFDSMPIKRTRKDLLFFGVCDPVLNILAELPTRGEDSRTEEIEWEGTLLVWELSCIFWQAMSLSKRE